METNPIRVCELLVGLPDVNVLGVDDDGPDEPLRVHVEIRGSRPDCPGCGGGVRVKDRPTVVLVDLPCFGRPTRLVWRKHRWVCVEGSCSTVSWTEQDPRIASASFGVDGPGRPVGHLPGRQVWPYGERSRYRTRL